MKDTLSTMTQTTAVDIIMQCKKVDLNNPVAVDALQAAIMIELASFFWRGLTQLGMSMGDKNK